MAPIRPLPARDVILLSDVSSEVGDRSRSVRTGLANGMDRSDEFLPRLKELFFDADPDIDDEAAAAPRLGFRRIDLGLAGCNVFRCCSWYKDAAMTDVGDLSSSDASTYPLPLLLPNVTWPFRSEL